MNHQFIQGVLFDWDKIDNDSYLKKIEAFRGVEKIEFTNAITFFVGENGSGKYNGSIHLCSYEETESFQVTEMFINNRNALLGRLLEK